MITMTAIKYVVAYDSTEKHSGKCNYTTAELINIYDNRDWTERSTIADFDSIDKARAAFEDGKSGVFTWYNACSKTLHFQTLFLLEREFDEDGELLSDTQIDEYAEPIILVENE